MHEILKNIVEFQNQLRILHWQTSSFARHKAYGEIYEELDDLIDKFVEVYQGKYPRIKFENELNIVLRDTEDLDLNQYILQFISVLINDISQQVEEKDSDLFNIRDEILALVHKLKYLLSLK